MDDRSVQNITVDEAVDDYSSVVQKKQCCPQYKRRRWMVFIVFLLWVICYSIAIYLKADKEAFQVFMIDSTADKITVALLFVGSLFFVFFLVMINVFYCRFHVYNKVDIESEEEKSAIEMSQRFDDV